MECDRRHYQVLSEDLMNHATCDSIKAFCLRPNVIREVSINVH
jgi:hypothetical protein